MYPPPALAKGVRGGGAGDRWKKNMALGARFQKLLGGGGLNNMVGSEGQRGAKFSEEARPSRASCYVFL